MLLFVLGGVWIVGFGLCLFGFVVFGLGLGFVLVIYGFCFLSFVGVISEVQ